MGIVGPPAACGLTSDEARRRIREFGWNEPASERGHAFFFQCVSLLSNPILLILLAAVTRITSENRRLPMSPGLQAGGDGSLWMVTEVTSKQNRCY